MNNLFKSIKILIENTERLVAGMPFSKAKELASNPESKPEHLADLHQKVLDTWPSALGTDGPHEVISELLSQNPSLPMQNILNLGRDYNVHTNPMLDLYALEHPDFPGLDLSHYLRGLKSQDLAPHPAILNAVHNRDITKDDDSRYYQVELAGNPHLPQEYYKHFSKSDSESVRREIINNEAVHPDIINDMVMNQHPKDGGEYITVLQSLALHPNLNPASIEKLKNLNNSRIIEKMSEGPHADHAADYVMHNRSNWHFTKAQMFNSDSEVSPEKRKELLKHIHNYDFSEHYQKNFETPYHRETGHTRVVNGMPADIAIALRNHASREFTSPEEKLMIQKIIDKQEKNHKRFLAKKAKTNVY